MGDGKLTRAALRAAGFVFTFADVYQAYIACGRGKQAKRKAQRYALQLLDNLSDNVHALNSGTWHPSPTSPLH